MTDLSRAIEFAKNAHSGQVRKYTGEDYIGHPVEVMGLVRSVPHTEDMLVAAVLHDVVEDTPVTLHMIEKEFGWNVTSLVDWLTDVSIPSDGNRATRKALDRNHISHAPREAKTIKLADLIDNTSSIGTHDPKFWAIYRLEKLALLEVLRDGDETLWGRAYAQCIDTPAN